MDYVVITCIPARNWNLLSGLGTNLENKLFLRAATLEQLLNNLYRDILQTSLMIFTQDKSREILAWITIKKN